jgi:hypothetical protein
MLSWPKLELASIAKRNTRVDVYKTAAAESTTRASEAKPAAAETVTRTSETVACHANLRYQQALEPAGLAQCPDAGAIAAGDYGKVNYYFPYSCFMHMNAFIRGHGK